MRSLADHRSGLRPLRAVGSDSRSWTVLPADQVAEIHSTRVRAIPLAPAITIAGGVVVAEDAGSAAECAVAAFRDEGIRHRP